MGSVCEIQASGDNEEKLQQAISASFGEIVRLEGIFSLYQAQSETTELTRRSINTPHPCSLELFDLLSQSLNYSHQTEGAFDITKSNRGYRFIDLNDRQQSVMLKKAGMSLDFGGIGKGYALDKAAEKLSRLGVEKVQLNFSGQILILNRTPQTHRVDVSDPLNANKNLMTLYLSSGSVSTSSQIQHKNHIVNPLTGKPVDFQGSVTVIAPSATKADALSTALLVLGPEKGIPLMESEFKDSAVLYVVPAQTGWKFLSSSQMALYQVPAIPNLNKNNGGN